MVVFSSSSLGTVVALGYTACQPVMRTCRARILTNLVSKQEPKRHSCSPDVPRPQIVASEFVAVGGGATILGASTIKRGCIFFKFSLSAFCQGYSNGSR